jgi:hypothetical protein
MGEREREKRNERTGAIVSVAVHGAAILAMVLIAGWKAPNPPLPEYGIELNFGLADAGTGEVQPEEVPDATEPSEEQVSSESEEQAEETAANETEAEPVTEAIVSKVESPVVTKEEKKEPAKPKEAPKEPVKEEKPVLAEYKKPSESATKDNADGKTVSQGDQKDKIGDQGKPESTLDANALYGKTGGGGGGPSLDLTGWTWDYIPKPDIKSGENGKVVFLIEVDDRGEILKVTTEERSVSPEVEKALLAEVRKLTFSRISDGAVPEVSKGRITFVLRSR